MRLAGVGVGGWTCCPPGTAADGTAGPTRAAPAAPFYVNGDVCQVYVLKEVPANFWTLGGVVAGAGGALGAGGPPGGPGGRARARGGGGRARGRAGRRAGGRGRRARGGGARAGERPGRVRWGGC